MLCRASSGENVPELCALLSMEFGLSGESVRTRKALRCDDAQRDIRVNQRVCRELGIASVMVMPVVQDDEVLGVFELFSQRVNAFGESDVSALQRLSEMVDTAVRLAQAVEKTPDQLLQSEVSVAPPVPGATKQASIKPNAQPARAQVPVVPHVPAPPPARQPAESPKPQNVNAGPAEKTTVSVPADAAQVVMSLKKPLFWSAAETSTEPKGPETDHSHIPPILRNLRQCSACGFPVSAERTLCVECEEKKWRGQLKPKDTARPQPVQRQESPEVSAPVARLKSAAQANSAAAAVAPAKVPDPPAPVTPAEPQISPSLNLSTPVAEATAEPSSALPELVLSAALPPAQSWISRNRFVLVAIVAVAAVAIILLLR